MGLNVFFTLFVGFGLASLVFGEALRFGFAAARGNAPRSSQPCGTGRRRSGSASQVSQIGRQPLVLRLNQMVHNARRGSRAIPPLAPRMLATG